MNFKILKRCVPRLWSGHKICWVCLINPFLNWDPETFGQGTNGSRLSATRRSRYQKYSLLWLQRKFSATLDQRLYFVKLMLYVRCPKSKIQKVSENRMCQVFRHPLDNSFRSCLKTGQKCPNFRHLGPYA